MRRFVLVTLLSLCSFAAFATVRVERSNYSSRNDLNVYEISQITIGDMAMENPYQTVVSSSDDTFNFVTADGVVTKIIVNNDTEMATIFSNGEISHVKAKITKGKNGKIVLAYGGYEIVLHKVVK